MRALSRDGRPAILLRRVTRHSWGPDPSRVVVVAVVREGEETTARVFGAEGGRPVELERIAGAEIPKVRGGVRIHFADGTEWSLQGVGCSCNVPRALKGFNPLAVPTT